MEVTVPYATTSLKGLLTDLHPQHFLTLKSAVAESVGLSAENKVLRHLLLSELFSDDALTLLPMNVFRKSYNLY